MSIDLIPLLVNEVPALSIDTWRITYSPVSNVVYEIGVAGSGGVATITSHDGTTGALLASQVLSTSMPLSGKTASHGNLYRQIAATPDGTEFVGVTTAGAGTRAFTKWDGTSLIETAFATFAHQDTLSDYPVGTFALDGTDYAITQFITNAAFGRTICVKVVDVSTMASVLETTFLPDQAATDEPLGLLIGAQPSSHEQAIYSLTRTAWGSAGYEIKLRKMIFDSDTGTLTSNARIATYLSTEIDAHWSQGFTQNMLLTNAIFDASDGNIILQAQYLSTQAVGATTDGYLLKISSSAKSIIWQLAVPANEVNSNTPSGTILTTGVLKFLPGYSLRGYVYPWAEPDEVSGPLLVIDTSDGTYSIERYAEFARAAFTINAQRPGFYLEATDTLFFYDVDGVNGAPAPGSGWYGAVLNATPPGPGDDVVMIGATNLMLDTLGFNIDTSAVLRRKMFPRIDTGSEIHIGPFRYAEQKAADETSSIDGLIAGVSESRNGEIVQTEDWMTDGEDEDFNLDDNTGEETEDWGYIPGFPDLFDTELMNTDDGRAPQYQGIDPLLEVEEFNASRKYGTQGFSAIMHRVRFFTSEAGHKFYIKLIDIAGLLTGRHK